MRSASVSVVLILVVVAMASAAPSSDKPLYDLSDADNIFEKFIKDFGRNYIDEEDKQTHKRAFVQNMEKINKLNAQGSSATYGINKFADYTDEERKGMFGLRKPEN